MGLTKERRNATLINLRENYGLTQREVAKNIGISQTLLSQIETGDRNPSLETAKKIATFYGTTVDKIF